MIKTQKSRLLVGFFLSLLLIGNTALAHDPSSGNDFWAPGEPIVSCGTSQDYDPGPSQDNDTTVICDRCQFLHMVRHIIDFLMIVAAPVLATFFLIVAGVYIMLGGANPGMLSRGKKMFTDTLVGVLIVLLAWLMVNTLIKSLAKAIVTFPIAYCVNNSCSNGRGACTEDTHCGTIDWDSGRWWEFSCQQLLGGGGNPPPLTPPPLPGCTATLCVSGERATNITSSGATIIWTTNIPATSQVEWVGDIQLGEYTPIDSNLKTSHSVVLSGLGSNAGFSYRVISTAGGYTKAGSTYRFTTR